MRVDDESCIGCFNCVAYCPVEAIREDHQAGKAVIDEAKCVECGVCLRSANCPSDALYQPELAWPRILRAEFSNPAITLSPGVKTTGVTGRGTEETKTNDVTGRYPRGYIGIAAELGRPGTGTCLGDIERVARAILSLGVHFEKENPTYNLFEDVTTGKLREGIAEERVLSAILEFKTTEEKAPEVLKTLAKVAKEVNTVITVNIASRFAPDRSLPAARVAQEGGFSIRPNGKSNLGLGLPLIKG